MSATLTAALEYAALDWKIVPLYGVLPDGKCECGRSECGRSTGKHPRVSAWQTQATVSEEQIATWFEQWPNMSIGVQFGESSGILDIECDSPEAESMLSALFGGEFPDTPTFKSGRGKHRLFKWRLDLPNPGQANWKIGALEFRTGNGERGCQSVFPPSPWISERGELIPRHWIIRPSSKAEIAEIPDSVVTRIANAVGDPSFLSTKPDRPKSPRRKLYEQEQVVETVDGRDDVLYREACNMWREKWLAYGGTVFESEDRHGEVYEMLRAWNVSKCSPRLDDETVWKKCQSARQFMLRAAEKNNEEAGRKLTQHGLEWREGEWFPGTWKLTVVLSDPPRYRLFVPAWKDLIRGDRPEIELTLNQFSDHRFAALAILEATKTVVLDSTPGMWSGIWNGRIGAKNRPAVRGLKSKLMDVADEVEPLPDELNIKRAAERLLSKLKQATKKPEPDKDGRLTQLPDGTIWLKWYQLWEQERLMREFEESKLTELKAKIGVTPKDYKRFPDHPKPGEERSRYLVLGPDHMRRLEGMVME